MAKKHGARKQAAAKEHLEHSEEMTLFKLKTGQILNLDWIVRITPRIDVATKKPFIDVELGGLNVTIRDEDDLAAFAVITERATAARI